MHSTTRTRSILLWLLLTLAFSTPCMAEDFKLVFFFEAGIDDAYQKLFGANTFEAAVQHAGPLAPDSTLRVRLETYRLSQLADCAKRNYSGASRFPEMTPSAEIQLKLGTLLASEAPLSANLTASDRAKRLAQYLNTRWSYRRYLADAIVICYRQDPKYQTKSISYPVLYVVVPAIDPTLPLPNASPPIGNKTATIQGVLALLQKTQGKAPPGYTASGETFAYHRVVGDIAHVDLSKIMSWPREVVVLAPLVGGIQPDERSAAHLVVHELGHYLGLAHTNTENYVLNQISPGRPASDHSAERCASLVVFGAGGTWYINDQDYLESGVTDTLSQLGGPGAPTIQASLDEKACYEAQRKVLAAHGVSGKLFRALDNVMATGNDFAPGEEWSPSQLRVVKARARDLLRAAQGP
jgi:hypothetical protein